MAVSFYNNFSALPYTPAPPPPLPGAAAAGAPPLLGPNNGWVVGSIRECSILAVVKEAVAPATVADEEEGSQEDQGTDGAGLSLQQEAEQVEPHEHGVVEPQSWVQRLGDEQHGEQPLKAIHCLFLEGGRRCFLFQIYE